MHQSDGERHTVKPGLHQDSAAGLSHYPDFQPCDPYVPLYQLNYRVQRVKSYRYLFPRYEVLDSISHCVCTYPNLSEIESEAGISYPTKIKCIGYFFGQQPTKKLIPVIPVETFENSLSLR